MHRAEAADDSTLDILHLPAIADIWISNATPKESASSAGGSPVFKLKSVQEMAALRFDLAPAKGLHLLSARLHLRLRHGPAPRWLRVSTVSANWIEGTSTGAYEGTDGASWKWADSAARKEWSWPGSAFCDVIMGEGYSQVVTLSVQEDKRNWISVDLPLSLVSSMLCEHSNGLALMEGGSPFERNYYFYSRQAWSNEPWLELTLKHGPTLPQPAPPHATLRPAPSRASLRGGATAVSIAPDSLCFAWRAWLDGEALPPWRVPLPIPAETTLFYLEDLDPGQSHHLSLEALNSRGRSSARSEFNFSASKALDVPTPLETPSPLKPPPDLESRSALKTPSGRTPSPTAPLPLHPRPPRLWALPPLSQLDPLSTHRLDREEVEKKTSNKTHAHPWDTNVVWDGRSVHLLGARGETLSFQTIVQADVHTRDSSSPPVIPTSFSIEGSDLVSSRGDTLHASSWSFSRVWYFHREDGQWQPSYLLPFGKGIDLPWKGEEPGLLQPANRAVFAEIEVDRDLPAGRYRGELLVRLHPGGTHLLPVDVEVFPFTLPSDPGFRIELNAYHWRQEALQQFRLARKHRCVFTPWVARPRIVERRTPVTEGDESSTARRTASFPSRADSTGFSLDWNEYDRLLGPLLDGSAFPQDPRPLEVLYLPFSEGWPTRLTPENYSYPAPWPGRGDAFSKMWPHHETAPPLQEALAPVYLARFRRVEAALVRHFDEKKWKGTELHCFFGSKMKNRTDYGHSTWWNTDEPLYWPDWSALRFYLQLFEKNLPGAKKHQWLTRADISRPQWLRGALGETVCIVYTGGILDAAQARRCRQLARDLGLRWQVYSAAGDENAPPAQTAAWALGAWMDGARGALVWQTLAPKDAWTAYDPPDAPGTALLATWPKDSTLMAAPEEEPALVTGDLRLKALRDAQQLSEWLEEFARRKNYRRAQMRLLLQPFFHLPPQRWWHDSQKGQELVRFGTMDPEALQALRHRVMALLYPHGPADSTP